MFTLDKASQFHWDIRKHISDSPEHLWHSKHEGVMEEETQYPTQEVRSKALPQSMYEDESIVPPFPVLLQQVSFFCWSSWTNCPGPGPGPRLGQSRTCRLLSAEHQNQYTGMVKPGGVATIHLYNQQVFTSETPKCSTWKKKTLMQSIIYWINIVLEIMFVQFGHWQRPFHRFHRMNLQDGQTGSSCHE